MKTLNKLCDVGMRLTYSLAWRRSTVHQAVPIIRHCSRRSAARKDSVTCALMKRVMVSTTTSKILFAYNFYPNVTTLRSGVCYRKSVCCLSVCVERWCTLLRGLNLSAIYLHRCVPWRSDLRAKFFSKIVPGNPSVGSVKRKPGSKIERLWTYRRQYLINSRRYGLGYN